MDTLRQNKGVDGSMKPAGLDRSDTEMIIVTSLNPFSRLQTQLRCFIRWKELGLRIMTANVPNEAEKLQEAGLNPEDILLLEARETGQELHGKPVPKIAVVLQRLQGLCEHAPVALVNSDIYPAMRSASVMQHWLSLFPALALTREDCVTPEIYEFSDRKPYRGGLDAFLFSYPALERVLHLLKDCTATERMSFGIPGWDYLLGALIGSSEIGGSLMDSGMLLHENHPTTYGEIREYAHYLTDMNRIAGTSTGDFALAAAQFKAQIDQACIANARQSQQAKTMFFSAVPQAGINDAAYSVAAVLSALSPAVSWNALQRGIALLATRDISNRRADYYRAKMLLEINSDPQFRFSQRLLAILFCLATMKHGDIGCGITSKYPYGNLHTKAAEEIRSLHEHSASRGRLEFAELFGAELVGYGIFNPRLYNYLVQCCETDEERRLLSEIHDYIGYFQGAA